MLDGATGNASLALEESAARFTARTAAGDWAAGREVSVGVVLYTKPADVDDPVPLAVSATGPQALTVLHERDQGWHRIILPKGDGGDNASMRARIQVTNPGPVDRMARFNFDGVPFYIPGLSAVLRDGEGFPMGVPVQLSKNWHGPASKDTGPASFAGHWFHGLTMLRIPAGSTQSFELMMVGENWGGIAAATHSQLSVIGYGGNQQWDEAALGNRGEALCYDMDHVLTDNDFTDSRPFGALDPAGKRNWGVNVGGGSVLRYIDAAGVTRRHGGMRVRYVRYCPNLAEAVFAGRTDDGAMDFRFSAGILRADDCTRGLHRIRIDVRRDTAFQRLAFYQQAGDSYCYNQGGTLATGNAAEPAPLREWKASGVKGRDVGEPVPMTGPMPWAAVLGGKAEEKYRPANHGFIVRSWKARLQGRDADTPHLRERRNPQNVSVLELAPPPGVDRLNAGDFVEAEIVRVVVPQTEANYGGANAHFRQALREFPDDARMILREAAGNRVAVEVGTGTLERLYPVQIRAKDNRAAFVMRGGVGAVPVTFTGLSDYRRPVLEQRVDGAWVRIDQSVAGNDFWQCDFNAGTGTWEITFTIQPDGPYQSPAELIAHPIPRTFRFGANLPPES
ncbi:MAG: hypothetical protein U1F77_15180 [Kiritimatiellia bacterium]